MRKAMLLAPVLILGLTVGAAAAVPSVRAEAGARLASFFGIAVNMVVYEPSYLPESLKQKIMVQVKATPDGSSSVSTYQGGSQFASLVQKRDTDSRQLPPGKQVTVAGQPGALETGLQGEREVQRISPPPGAGTEEPGKPVTVRIERIIRVGESGDPSKDGASSTGTQRDAGSTAEVPVEVHTEKVPYRDARRLTWFLGDYRMTLLSDLPEDELMKVAESLRPRENDKQPGG